jgi:hypothetical protein
MCNCCSSMPHCAPALQYGEQQSNFQEQRASTLERGPPPHQRQQPGMRLHGRFWRQILSLQLQPCPGGRAGGPASSHAQMHVGASQRGAQNLAGWLGKTALVMDMQSACHAAFAPAAVC